jgi:sporulation protein YlmC with PRC-barrel domain
MPAEFTMGVRASCTDGFCGEVRRTILDPAAGTVTHLVVEPRHLRGEPGRLVPVGLAQATEGEVKLGCTLAEFKRLDPAEEVEVLNDAEYGFSEAVGVGGFGNVGSPGVAGPTSGIGLGASQPIVVSHSVPLGETEVGQHEHVHAVDGEIGQVEGFVVDSADHTVTHVILKEGHLWGRKQVAIPVSAVASVADGIRLNITKEQVGNLPPVSADGT